VDDEALGVIPEFIGWVLPTLGMRVASVPDTRLCISSGHHANQRKNKEEEMAVPSLCISNSSALGY
jgi:hypothetical protein